ncbi:unnamed protein product [Cladocopium goreaui]|uniref:Uncharacterized protein n=1 Tax=Cladocopium goreaui TaxID=2562237 RepID=A0A9P1DV14_9DINO|nr:unnamed protein product [Cladocopium goreaui]
MKKGSADTRCSDTIATFQTGADVDHLTVSGMLSAGPAISAADPIAMRSCGVRPWRLAAFPMRRGLTGGQSKDRRAKNQNGKSLLLMEEILHHLGWLKPYK